jgi:hypothetical protein
MFSSHRSFLVGNQSTPRIYTLPAALSSSNLQIFPVPDLIFSGALAEWL